MKTFTKYFTLVMALVAVLSCGEKEQPAGGLGVKIEGAVLGFDKNVIKADDNDQVTFTAYYDGNNVDDQATIYTKGKSGKFDTRVGKTFSTDTPGNYEFIVQYKTNKSDVVTITAITRDIPSAVADPQPSKTSFVHRTFFNQFTGANCGFCPFMTHLLDQTLTNGYEDKVVLAEIRNYDSTESSFANVPNSGGGFPYLLIDYANSFDHNQGSKAAAEELQRRVDQWTSAPAKVGISANPVYYSDGQILVKVSVKAAVTDEYNVGLWLMQDNVHIPQKFGNDVPGALDGTWDTGYMGDPSKNRYDYHHNAVRVAASKYMGSHVGFPLGKIEAGKTADWIFVINVKLQGDDISYGWWEEFSTKVNLDDLHLAAFVTSHKGTRYTVENAIDFKYNEAKPFDYK